MQVRANVDRRRFVKQSAAAAAAGVAGAVLSAPPEAQAAASHAEDAICYVRWQGSDRSNGRTWGTAFRSISHALKVMKAGTIMLGGGYFEAEFEAEWITIKGADRSATVLVGRSPGGSTVRLGDGVTLEGVWIDGTNGGHVPFRGVHLEVVGTQVAVRDVRVEVPDHFENRNTGLGGVGLWTHGGEGCVFDNLRIEHTQQAILIGGANHLLTQLRGSRNFKILSYDVSSGGHTFINSKFVNAGNWGKGPNATPVETISIGRNSDGNGASTFITCDWDESYANSIHTVVGDRSEFIRCVTAAGCHMVVQGRHNVFRNQTILGELVCQGDENEFWDPRLYSGWTGGVQNALRVNGARNLVYGDFPSNSQGVVGTGIRRLVYRDG